MKNILVPIDFSSTSETAFNYAVSLSKKLNSKLTLFHAYQVPPPITDIYFGILSDERKVLKEESEKKLKALSSKINSANTMQYQCISADGEAVDCILKAAK